MASIVTISNVLDRTAGGKGQGRSGLLYFFSLRFFVLTIHSYILFVTFWKKAA